MSHADVLRFVGDLKKNPEMLAKVKDSAAGLDSIVSLAKDHGYDISVDEAKDYLQSQSRQELTDEQMESLAGGKGGGSSSVTQVSTVQTVATVSTEATAVETTTGGVAEVEAVVVIVLT